VSAVDLRRKYPAALGEISRTHAQIIGTMRKTP
jgi:hypothetical protein